MRKYTTKKLNKCCYAPENLEEFDEVNKRIFRSYGFCFICCKTFTEKLFKSVENKVPYGLYYLKYEKENGE